MKKFFALILAIMLTISTMALSVNALAMPTTAIMSEAAKFLDNYLNNLKNWNISTAFATTNNLREVLNEDISISSLSINEQKYIKYVESGESFADLYAEEPITDYSILEEKENNIITAKLVFENGSEAIVPFNVVPAGDSYEVVYSLNDIEEMGYIETKSAVKKGVSTLEPLSSETLKDTYEFTYLYGTIYGLDKFSVSKNAIKINGYQANYLLSSGWTSNAEVIYAIVVKHWYGDNVWATTSNAIKKNGSFTITIVGKNSSQSNLQIRISNQTGANPRSEGKGSIYSVSV